MNTGFIYVLSNPLFPDYVKIGRAKCLYTRLKSLSTSVPKAFKVEYHVEVSDAKLIESKLHQVYGKQGWCIQSNTVSREWYHVGKKSIFDTVEDFVTDIKREIAKVDLTA